MKFKLFFRWYDIWIGIYIDRKNDAIYICPIPMIGLKIQFPKRHYLIVSKLINKPIGCCYDIDDVRESHVEFIKINTKKCPICGQK